MGQSHVVLVVRYLTISLASVHNISSTAQIVPTTINMKKSLRVRSNASCAHYTMNKSKLTLIAKIPEDHKAKDGICSIYRKILSKLASELEKTKTYESKTKS